MQISWADRLGDIPIATITHGWTSVLGDVAVAATNIRRVFNRELDDFSLLKEYARQVFLVKTTAFRGQRVEIDDTVINAQVMDVGEAYDATAVLQNLFALVSASQLPEGSLVRIVKQFGLDAAGGQRKPGNPFVQAAFATGCDVIRKDVAGNCFAIRDRFGESIVLLSKFTFTDRTGHIATEIATNKIWTMSVLAMAGLPVPDSLLTNTVNDAISFFSKGGPKASVVKPVGTDFGIAVFTNLRSVDEVANAYRIAAKHGRVLIQEHIAGEDFRILVVDGVIAGVTRRKLFHVTGNGAETIEQLAKAKLARRADDDFYRRFNRIDIGSAEIATTLSRQGLSLTDVLPAGVVARLRDNPNVSAGGEHEIVDTASCHPDNLDLAVHAANAVGLDMAGVDCLSRDITKSWRENGAKICEINPTPAMSVAAGVDLLLKRLNVGGRGAAGAEPGDTLIIADATAGSAAGRADAQAMKCDQDLDRLSERQYFYQAYLAKKRGAFTVKISLDRLLQYGCPNRHVSRAILDAGLVVDDHVIADLRKRLPPGCAIETGSA